MTPDNTFGAGECRTCRNARQRAYRAEVALLEAPVRACRRREASRKNLAKAWAARARSRKAQRADERAKEAERRRQSGVVDPAILLYREMRARRDRAFAAILAEARNELAAYEFFVGDKRKRRGAA